MGYQKLTVEQFVANLKDGRYAGLTGARRSIGKTAGWNDAERKRAHAAADKHFGTAGAATSKGKTAKKPAKKAAKKTAKRAVAKTAAPKAPKVKAAKTATKTARRAPATTLAKDGGSVTGRLMQNDDPATVRQHSASTVIAALRNAGQLNPLEQRAYAIATAEYAASASEEALHAVNGRIPEPKKAPPVKKAATPTLAVAPTTDRVPAVSVPTIVSDTASRIPVPNGYDSSVSLEDLSAEELAQHERLKKSAAAVGVIPPTS